MATRKCNLIVLPQWSYKESIKSDIQHMTDTPFTEEGCVNIYTVYERVCSSEYSYFDNMLICLPSNPKEKVPMVSYSIADRIWFGQSII